MKYFFLDFTVDFFFKTGNFLGFLQKDLNFLLFHEIVLGSLQGLEEIRHVYIGWKGHYYLHFYRVGNSNYWCIVKKNLVLKNELTLILESRQFKDKRNVRNSTLMKQLSENFATGSAFTSMM